MTTSDKTNSGMNDQRSTRPAPGTRQRWGKLGKVDTVHFDNATDKPAWAGVKSGLFGTHIPLVPNRPGRNGADLPVPFEKAALRNAPHHDPDTAKCDQERELCRHCGMSADRHAAPRARSDEGHGQSRMPAGGRIARRSPVGPVAIPLARTPTTRWPFAEHTRQRGQQLGLAAEFEHSVKPRPQPTPVTGLMDPPTPATRA